MSDKKLNAFEQLYPALQDERALPMVKLSDEAVALLNASNSVLNSLALQGVNIPPRLLTELTQFCRENTGFQVPFPQLATMVVDVGHSEWPADQIQRLGYDIFHQGQGINNLTVNLAVAGRASRPIDRDSRQLLNELGQLELRLERLYQYFGWSKSIVRAAARQKLDADAEKQGG